MTLIRVRNRGTLFWPWVVEWQIDDTDSVVRWFYREEQQARQEARMLEVMYG